MAVADSITARIEDIQQHIGQPTPPTRIPEHPVIPDDLRQAVAAGIAGSYENGLLSVWGDRECVKTLGGWEVWLPKGSFIVATTAFGDALVWGGDRSWILLPQYGQVVESNLSLSECVQVFATDEDETRAKLFREWKSKVPLGPSDVLVTIPLLALGGEWDAKKLHPEPFEIFLGMTAGLFEPGGSMPADIRRNS